jgi:hypothetical protein
MKFHSNQNIETRAGGGWLRGSVLALALGFLAFAPSFATGDDKRDGEVTTTGGGDGVAGGDDETVGTLPVYFGGSTLTLHRRLAISGPSLCLQGNVWEVMSSIVGVNGESDALVTLLDPATGLVEIVIPGDVLIAIDRMSLASGSVRIGLYMPSAMPTQVVYGWNGRLQSIPGAPGLVSLPIVELGNVGALDRGPFQAFAGTRASPTDLGVFATPDVLLLQQTH